MTILSERVEPYFGLTLLDRLKLGCLEGVFATPPVVTLLEDGLEPEEVGGVGLLPAPFA